VPHVTSDAVLFTDSMLHSVGSHKWHLELHKVVGTQLVMLLA
jgi:hypothetical protein